MNPVKDNSMRTSLNFGIRVLIAITFLPAGPFGLAQQQHSSPAHTDKPFNISQKTSYWIKSDPKARIHKVALFGSNDERLQVAPRRTELNQKYDGLGDLLNAVVYFFRKIENGYSPIGTGTLVVDQDVVITSAHQFYEYTEGKAGTRIARASIFAVIAGCPEISFRVFSDDIPDFKSERGYYHNDIALIRLSKARCNAATPLIYAKTSAKHVEYFSKVEGSIVLAGGYMPETVKQQRDKFFGRSIDTDESHMGRADSNTVVTYYSTCRLAGEISYDFTLGAHSLYKHLCDTGPGGSGGPLLANFGPAIGWRLIGVHVAESRVSNPPEFNEAVPITDAILSRVEAFLSTSQRN